MMLVSNGVEKWPKSSNLNTCTIEGGVLITDTPGTIELNFNGIFLRIS